MNSLKNMTPAAALIGLALLVPTSHSIADCAATDEMKEKGSTVGHRTIETFDEPHVGHPYTDKSGRVFGRNLPNLKGFIVETTCGPACAREHGWMGIAVGDLKR